jgi:hypothetical protein
VLKSIKLKKLRISKNMSDENVKTMQEVVRETKQKNSNELNKTLMDEFAMAALTGLLATNSMKDAAKKSYLLALEMMEARKL